MDGLRYNPPPGWPVPPAGWSPPAGWKPDPKWPEPPPGWQLWVPIVEQPPTPTAASSLLPLPPPPPSLLPAGLDEVTSMRGRIAELEEELRNARLTGNGVVELDDERVLQEVGIYRYHHPLENAVAYRGRLDAIEEQMKEFVRSGRAILASDMFTFNNSLARGRKMVADLSKLMLRAYNAEADNCVRSLRAGNALTAKKRLEAAIEAIAKLGSMMEMKVNPDYHALRIEEIELTADWQMMLQVEREQAREERERLREERRAEQELAAERERLEKERTHYANAIEALRAKGDESGAAELLARAAEIDAAIAQNDYRAANVRAGYVYVISNRGAFGPNMVKIGMTRRLEPLDRVRELGDASVPFPYDVHAIYFSDDAVTLETDLHHAFAHRKVNLVNERREFFFANPTEVRDVLIARLGSLLQYEEHAESTEYLQSRGRWETGLGGAVAERS